MANSHLKILDIHKFIGCNYKVWYRNLRIILDSEKIDYVLDKPLLKNPYEKILSLRKKIPSRKWQDDNLKIRSYMLASTSDELQAKT